MGKIGAGGFAKVYLVKDSQSNQLLALKKISKGLLVNPENGLSLDNVLSEKQILIEVKSPFVVSITHCFQDEKSLYFVMEYCKGGSLAKYLKERKYFSELLTRFYLSEILMGLKALHEDNQVIYRDLKPDNVLLGEDGHVKLADFGLSVIGKNFSRTGTGTPEYIAPEILSGVPHSRMVDFWSLGCMAYVMFFGKFPFYHDKRKVQFDIIMKGKYSYPDKPEVSREAKSLIAALLVVNPSGRLGYKGVQEVMDHAFFRGVDWEKVKSRQEKPPLNTTEDELIRESLEVLSMTVDYPVQGFTYEAHSPVPAAARQYN